MVIIFLAVGLYMKELSEKHSKVLRALKKLSLQGGTTYDELSKLLKINKSSLYVYVYELRDAGYPISIRDNILYLEKPTTDNSKELKIKGDYFRIGLVADTHIGSKNADIHNLHKFYQIAEEWGADMILHAGDITEGFNVYKGQENEIEIWGADEQVAQVVDKYPDNLPTSFITGNHDLAVMKTAGVDIGKMIAKERQDMEYLGRYKADVKLGDFTIRLLHPDGGASYALSYRPQRYVEGYLAKGDNVGMLVYGHLHEQLILHHADTYVVLPGCFQKPTDYIIRKGLHPVIGGVLAEINAEQDKTEIIFKVVKLTKTL